MRQRTIDETKEGINKRIEEVKNLMKSYAGVKGGSLQYYYWLGQRNALYTALSFVDEIVGG